MDILSALKQLDPDNDEQWTRDGLPQVALVRTLTGEAKLTRKAITEAAPAFSRENLVLPGSTPEPAPEAEPEPEEQAADDTGNGEAKLSPSGQRAAEIQAAENERQREAASLERIAELTEERDAWAAKLAVLEPKLKKLQDEHTAINKELDRLNAKLETPEMDHLAQQEARMRHIREGNLRAQEQAAAKRRAMRKLGLDQVTDLRSPLDQDLGKRASGRTVRPPMNKPQ